MDQQMQDLIKKFGLEGKTPEEMRKFLTERAAEIEKKMAGSAAAFQDILKEMQDILGNGSTTTTVPEPPTSTPLPTPKPKKDELLERLIKRHGLEGQDPAEIRKVLKERVGLMDNGAEILGKDGRLKQFIDGDDSVLTGAGKPPHSSIGAPTQPATPTNPNHSHKPPKSYLGRFGNIVKVGAALGVAETVLDKKDDSILSTAGNIVGDTALVGSAYAAWKIGVPLAKSTTVGSMIKDSVHKLGSEIVDNGVEAARARKVQRGVGLGFKIYAGIIAVGTVADIGLRLHDRSEANNMEYQQEHNLKKAKKEEKKKNAETRTSNLDMGQIAIDLFNERSGHHKMGNAKFY
jgi:hypothetical protein